MVSAEIESRVAYSLIVIGEAVHISWEDQDILLGRTEDLLMSNPQAANDEAPKAPKPGNADPSPQQDQSGKPTAKPDEKK
jgi:hypothetical protein